MDIKKAFHDISKQVVISVLAAAVIAVVLAGWAVMDNISLPVAIVVGLAAFYIVIAIVSAYKKSEWPFDKKVEQVVKDAIEHAGYTNIGQSSELVFHYQITVDGNRIGIFQRRGNESVFFVAADWVHDTLFNGWPVFERQSFICAIKDDLLKLKLDHKTEDCGFRVKAPIFCDRSSISSAEIHEKVVLIGNTIQLMQLKWMLVGMRLDAKKADGRQHEDVPLRTALLRAYENCENSKLGTEIREKLDTESGLTSYLLSRLEDTDATLYGNGRWSTVAKELPKSETQALMVVEGRSDLAERVNKEKIIYSDVYITQSDFIKFMGFVA